jgi:hypothetical protein
VAEAEESVAEAELLADGDRLAEPLALPVATPEPLALPDAVALPDAAALPDGDAEPESDALADGNSEPAEEALLPPLALTWAPLATGLVTDCSCSVCGPLLMITSRNRALPPLAELPPCSSATTAAARMEMAPASADAPSIGGR